MGFPGDSVQCFTRVGLNSGGASPVRVRPVLSHEGAAGRGGGRVTGCTSCEAWVSVSSGPAGQDSCERWRVGRTRCAPSALQTPSHTAGRAEGVGRAPQGRARSFSGGRGVRGPGKPPGAFAPRSSRGGAVPCTTRTLDEMG
jgi:hypothetical protein